MFLYRYILIVLWIIFQSGVAITAQNSDASLRYRFGLVEHLDTLDLKTGDIFLFQSMTFNGRMIQLGSCAPFTHVAMVIKNPDGTYWITHSTDNEFYGTGIPVLFEEEWRSGVILTRLEDSFISTDAAKTGFYKTIWLCRFNEKTERPDRDSILKIYDEHKHFPFEKSKIRFALAAFDLKLFGFDLLQLPSNNAMFCSEYFTIILDRLGIRTGAEQSPDELTPTDVRNFIPYRDSPLIPFKFIDGKYRIQN